ncbi:helix-turn-helix domain-containing protein [Rhodoferax sp.]|uniref:helix-turn-helix domain-containing protein n=1 Tax=Rhodoferax sp. TaxID=50421 RepID=UPI0025D3E58E|nr:helix-turn-helix domain-containing protein [Rhodoferax sp.]
MNAEQINQISYRAAAGESKAAIAREFGISRETVYSYLRQGSSTVAAAATANAD